MINNSAKAREISEFYTEEYLHSQVKHSWSKLVKFNFDLVDLETIHVHFDINHNAWITKDYWVAVVGNFFFIKHKLNIDFSSMSNEL